MIVQIASKLYIEKGFTDTSNKEICEILNISPGNLTFHYPQREHVLTEFVKELCDFQWRMIEVLEYEDKSPLLALCIEFATNAAIAEESNAMRDIYIASYTHPMPLAVIRENDTRKTQQIFKEFNPDWTDEQFCVMENLYSAIEYGIFSSAGQEGISLDMRVACGLMRHSGFTMFPKTYEIRRLRKSSQWTTGVSEREFYSGDIWGQTLGEDTYSVLNGKKVFLCGTKYVNAHHDPCECTPIGAKLKIDDEAAFVDTYTYGDTIDITAEDFTTLSDPEQIVITWRDAEGILLKEAPVNAGSYKLVVSVPQTYYDDILYAEATLEIDITIEKAALEASNFTFTAPENLTYDGSEKTAMLTSNLDGIGKMTLTYYDENGEPLEGAPVNAGTYTIKVDIAENENCQAMNEITSENWTFTIGKADLTKADLIVIGSQYQVYDKNGNPFTVVLSDSIVGAGELTVTYANENGEVDSINGAGTYTRC